MAKTAVIIGAGPAGLTAALKLLEETDYIPVVLEMDSQVGGIAKTITYKKNRMDLGGHRFFTKNERVNTLWNELLPIQGSPALDDKILGRQKPLNRGGPDPEQREEVMLVRDRISRIYYNRKFFDYPVTLNMQTIRNMGFRKTISGGFGYLHSCIIKRPEASLEDFMINRFGKPLYHMFFQDYTKKVWGKDPSQIDASWGAQRIKGLSLKKAIAGALRKKFAATDAQGRQVETSLIEQFTYPKRGPGQMWEVMARRVVEMGGQLMLGARVTGITVEDGKITRVLCQQNGITIAYVPDVVFSSMPIKDLILAIDDGVPIEVKQLARNLPYRDFITVGMLLDKLVLKNQTKMRTLSDIVPDCWMYIQEPDVKLGRLQIFNNWSPYLVNSPKQTVWVGLEYFCNEGDELWRMGEEDFISFATSELVKIGIIHKEDVKDAVQIKVKKAYPAYFGVYHQFHKIKSYLDTIENLYCIGRNGQHRYNNMDHSMLTAMTAVDALGGKASREDVWNVNTEEQYHEQKERS